MKKGILLTVVVACLLGSIANAETGELHGTIDATYVSRYIWRGYDAYPDDHSAIQPSVDLDLFGTGFGFTMWMSRANSSGFENSEWLTYTLYYKNMAWAEETYATAYKVGWTYFSFPDGPKRGTNPGDGDAQEIFGEFAWPKICPFGTVPFYAVYGFWPSESKAANRGIGGWAHVFGISKDFEAPAIMPGTDSQPINFTAYTVYNDAVGPNPQADHDWSHAVFSVKSPFPINDCLTFTPGFYYQSSWDDSINTSDEYWASMSLTYKF
jgi:hypothetical protein